MQGIARREQRKDHLHRLGRFLAVELVTLGLLEIIRTRVAGEGTLLREQFGSCGHLRGLDLGREMLVWLPLLLNRWWG